MPMDYPKAAKLITRTTQLVPILLLVAAATGQEPAKSKVGSQFVSIQSTFETDVTKLPKIRGENSYSSADVNAALGDIRAWRTKPWYGRPKGAGGTGPEDRKEGARMYPQLAKDVAMVSIGMQHDTRSQVIAQEVSGCVPPHGPGHRIQPPAGEPADLSR